MKTKFTDGRGKYHTAEESREPGYLAKRFEQIRKTQQKQVEERKTVVRPLRRVTG